MPGLNRLNYKDEKYWPCEIESVKDDDILSFIEKHIWLIPLSPRKGDYNVLADTKIDKEGAERLAAAARDCWQAVNNKDIDAWGKATTESFRAQIAMFPNMAPPYVLETINEYINDVKGIKITGAGGGGYLVIINDTPIKDALQIRIRRN